MIEHECAKYYMLYDLRTSDLLHTLHCGSSSSSGSERMLHAMPGGRMLFVHSHFGAVPAVMTIGFVGERSERERLCCEGVCADGRVSAIVVLFKILTLFGTKRFTNNFEK